MPTQEIKQIVPGGGGDFTSVQSWHDAQWIFTGGDLVGTDTIQIAELHGGNSGPLYIDIGTTPWVTDLGHYLQVRAANGFAHQGIFSTSRSYMNSSALFQPMFIDNGNLNDIRIGPGISLEDTNGDPQGWGFLVNFKGSRIIFDSCIVRDSVSENVIVNIQGGGTIKNCVLYSSTDPKMIQVTSSGVTNIYDCVIICDAGDCISSSNPANVVTSQNNYLSSGSADRVYRDGGTGIINKGSNDATANSEAITASLRNIAHSTANFVNVTYATADYHAKNGSALLLQGANLSSQGVTLDFEGDTRTVPFDIGADQYSVTVVSGGALLLACW